MKLTDEDAEDLIAALEDEYCRGCYSSGVSGGEPCDHCHGSGRSLTTAGRKLLEFLERHQTARANIRQEQK